MAAHTLVHEEAGRSGVRSRRRGELLQLGWAHFWMLAAILGGILSLVAMVFLVQILRA